MGKIKPGMNGLIPVLLGAIGGASFVQYYNKNPLLTRKLFSATDQTPETPFDYSTLGKFNKTNPLFATGDTIFSFGPRANYFFACRTSPLSHTDSAPRYLYRAYCNRESLATKRFGGSQDIPIYHSFSPHGDEFTISMNPTTEKVGWQFVTTSSRYQQAPTYSSLTTWLEQRISLSKPDLRKTFVVFGPGASYFARTTDDCTWHDLPQGLERIILEKKAKASKIETKDTTSNSSETNDSKTDVGAWIPRIVALGANDTWIGIWEDDRFAWSLNTKNALASEFESHTSQSYAALWENLVLSPHSATDYFSATKLGHLDWSVSSLNNVDTGIMELTTAADAYMQMRAKEDKSTFVLKQRVEGDMIDLVISPDSDWTDQQLTKLFTRKMLAVPEFIKSTIRSFFG